MMFPLPWSAREHHTRRVLLPLLVPRPPRPPLLTTFRLNVSGGRIPLRVFQRLWIRRPGQATESLTPLTTTRVMTAPDRAMARTGDMATVM